EAGTVVRGRGPVAGHRHPDAGSQALAQRARGRLDAAGPAVLGVPGALRVELAKPVEVIELDRRLSEYLVLRTDRPHAAEVQKRVKKRRAVTGGQDEAVAVAPDRVGGVEAK